MRLLFILPNMDVWQTSTIWDSGYVECLIEAWGSYLQECIDEALEVDSTVSSPIPKMDSEFGSVEE